jgi:FlaG/FlaF family flagellin (archaellin)
MVAITVILAAVIGTFVLGLGENVQSTAPSASFGFDYTQGSVPGTAADTLNGGGNQLIITHESGDSLDGDRVDVIQGSQSSNYDNGLSTTEISAGTSVTLAVSNTQDVRIVWNSEGGDNSATLGTFSPPGA